MNARLLHLPALDGLRGLALLGVLFFHAQGTLPGGYLGVDLFFVLSGFLITSLLLAEHEATKRIDLATFWVRRARRLFPALLSLMPAIAIYCWVFAKPEELARLRSEALATLAYVANWRAVLAHESYWELFTSPSPLEHTWSLAIEEQFYVVWPLVVWLVLRRGTRRSILATSVALGVASMIAMWVLSNAESTARAYMGTDTRATAILSGAALATIVSPNTTFTTKTVRLFDVLGAIAVAGLGVAWWRLDGTSSFLYRGGFWATEAFALALILCAVAGKASIVGRALAFRPLTYVGTISYGLYLWHWPVDVVLTSQRVHLHGAPLFAIQFAVTFAIAIASYHFYERPIRTNGIPFGRPAIVLPAAVGLALVLVVRSTHARKPIARPLPPPVTPLVIDDAGADAGPTFTVMVLGDSTANSLGWALRGVREPGVAVELRGKDSCTMLWDTCGGETWQASTTEVHPDVTLVFVGGAFLHGLDADGRWRQACYKKWDAQFEKTLAMRLVGLTNEKTRAYAVTVPYPVGPYDSAPWREKVDCINASVRKAAATVPDVKVLELGERFCPKGECEYEHNGFTVRPDGVHYDIDGANGIARWILDQLRPADAGR